MSSRVQKVSEGRNEKHNNKVYGRFAGLLSEKPRDGTFTEVVFIMFPVDKCTNLWAIAVI